MNNVEQLTIQIIKGITDRGGVATKRKVLLMIYLFDISYYREHQKTFTGWKWEFNDTSFFEGEDEILTLGANSNGI